MGQDERERDRGKWKSLETLHGFGLQERFGSLLVLAREGRVLAAVGLQERLDLVKKKPEKKCRSQRPVTGQESGTNRLRTSSMTSSSSPPSSPSSSSSSSSPTSSIANLCRSMTASLARSTRSFSSLTFRSCVSSVVSSREDDGVGRGLSNDEVEGLGEADGVRREGRRGSTGWRGVSDFAIDGRWTT